MFCSLRYRNFVLVWLGSLTEHFGEFMEIAAVLWLVHEMTHSPLILTIVGSCRFILMIPFSVISLIGGIVMSFNHPARLSMLPNLVDRKHLLNAVSLDTLSVQGARIGGMTLAGYLIAIPGVWSIFVLRAVGCWLAILWLFFAQIPRRPAATSELGPLANMG